MKNASLILNGVLLVAVAVLYYLHFSKPGSSSSSSGAQGVGGDIRVAYVNTDTLLKYYDFIKASAKEMESKATQMEQSFQSRATALQKEFESYQRNRNNMTIGQAQAVEEDLVKKRDNLQIYQQSLNQNMMAEQAKVREALYNKLTTYLRQYGKDKGLQYVFKFDATSDVLYGYDSLDISKQVIEGLNAAYKVDAAKPAADSTATKKKK